MVSSGLLRRVALVRAVKTSNLTQSGLMKQRIALKVKKSPENKYVDNFNDISDVDEGKSDVDRDEL
jgi:hypothetical protein